MNKIINSFLIISLTVIFFNVPSHAEGKSDNAQIFRVRLYFGLSVPRGGGLSLDEWQQFEKKVLAKTFDGFNVVDSTGYYKGKPERSKIVTIIVTEKEMKKVEEIAKNYADRFGQDSVMMVKVAVDEWRFIKGNK